MFGESDLQKHIVFLSLLPYNGIPLQSGEAGMHKPLVFTMISMVFKVTMTKQSVFTMNLTRQNTPVLSVFLRVLKVSSFFSDLA